MNAPTLWPPPAELLDALTLGGAAVWIVANLLVVLWLTYARAPVALARSRVALLIAGAPLAIAALAGALTAGLDLAAPMLAALAFAPFGSLGAWSAIARWSRPRLGYRDAALRHLDAPDLVLGDRHAADDVEAFNPEPVILPEKALYTNLHVVGGIGSGKTSAVVLPLLDQLMHKYPSAADHQPFVLLLDVKGGLVDTVCTIAAQAGRATDVIELTPGGSMTVNLLAGDPTVTASRLLDALAAGEEQPEHPFYRQAHEAFVRAALRMLAFVRGPDAYHLGDLYDLLTSPAARLRMRQAAERLVCARELDAPPRFLAYFTQTLDLMKPDEVQTMLLGLANRLALWVEGPFAETFCTSSPRFPGFRAAIGQGRVVVVTLPESTFGETLCRRVGLMLLAAFMDAALARTDPHAEIDRDRLVVAIIDEAQKFMSRRLATFASVSRQARCCTIILHQNLKQIPDAYREDLSANFRSHLVLNVSDAYTAEYFSRQLGEELAVRVTRGRSRTRGKHGAGVGQSESAVEVDRVRWGYTAIMQLAPERGVLSLYDGRRLRAPVVVRLMPWWRAGVGLGVEPG